MIKSLTANQLRPACTAESLPFDTTAELEDPPGIVGQERALKAVEFGIGVHHRGYNLYVMGPSGLGKHGIIRKYLAQKSAAEDVPADWCYVRNYEQDYKPYALKLPAGQGKLFKKDMKNLVEDIGKAINAAFEASEYQDQVQQIEKIFAKKQASLIDKHVERAESQNIALTQTPSGFMLMPMKNGIELSEEEYENLPDDEKDIIDSKIESFQDELDYLVPEISRQRREHNIKLKKLNRKVVLFATNNLIKDVKRRYKAFKHVVNYLKATQEDVLDHLEFFVESEDEESSSDSTTKSNALIRYQVNLIVDSSKKNGSPVIYLDNPTYHNLIGRIEYENRSTGPSTNFTLVKSGALLDANGGYLVIDAHKILSIPHAWDALKRSLYAKKVKIESLDQVLNTDTTITLEPEPIPLRIKVILLGNRITYYMLHEMDPDFAELFKVEADFDEEMPRQDENILLYARLIASRARKHNLRDLEAGAVARLIEFSSRIANNSEILSTRLRTIDDLLIETQYWAMQSDHQHITYDDVQLAIDAQIERTERIQKLIQKDIQRGTLLIDTDGEAVGLINGLSVYEVGKYSFGQPSRITASVHLGDGSIINIEREVDLSGSIHDKGVLILSALLANRYTKDTPLSFSASIAFEQSYGRIDGDSASLAELCVLISALTNIPLKQSFAVTGSLNQQGYVQAIGGVNEKIEGFFDICKQRGLTGNQGCIIPQVNVMNLLLRKDVIDAIESKQFHIYPVNHYEQALEVLTDLPAGEELIDGNFEKDSLNDRLMKKLCEYAKMRKASNISTVRNF
ncbi:MAG: AAA family ATPase [Gammaproteobacteria bacterium]|nr:AAA family ATPase [Gammaproteobacteria bacterium]MCW8909545.1 AAA family ATPase [Gammaproteobacteria bacterium]MCW9003971.1 AAA family ATPase [Gammaproteobacteria bacterium]MCW9055679.1 AAA family ATPase [Gammaproteobacteria bacterium]